MAKVEIDTSEVRALQADMTKVDSRLARHLRPVVSKGALNIKETLREEMSESSGGGKGFAPVTRAISYDLDDDGYGAVIGPEKGAPGSLANVAYFGTSRGGGTVADPEDALEQEADAFIEHLADMAEELALG